MKKMRNDFIQNKDHFLKELARSLKEQETRLLNEFQNTLNSKDQALVDTKQQAERLRREKFQGIMKERDQLSADLTRYKSKSDKIEEEYNQLSRKYDNLMNIHNEMIELDMHKNEKRLSVPPKQSNTLLVSPSTYFSSPIRQENSYNQSNTQTPHSQNESANRYGKYGQNLGSESAVQLKQQDNVIALREVC